MVKTNVSLETPLSKKKKLITQKAIQPTCNTHGLRILKFRMVENWNID